MLHSLFVFLVTLFTILGAGYQPASASEFPVSVMESTVSVLPHRHDTSSGTAGNASHLEEPEGSGVAVLDGMHIATAAHVLIGAEQVSIRLHNGRVIPAIIIGQDRLTDIALLKISVPVTPFAKADKGKLGESVCSVGNQFGLGLSVTCGVISALHQSNVGFNLIEDFIQTDAVVNPGASGGALVNMKGQLVGMLSGIFTKGSDANIGVNFAVHTELLMRVLSDLKDHGKVQWTRSGMIVQPLDLKERETQTGVRIVRVIPDGAAARAGLRPDDIIVTMKERVVLYPGDVSAIVYLHRPGETILMDVIRKGRPYRYELKL